MSTGEGIARREAMRVLVLALVTLPPSLAAAEPDTVEHELRVLALPSDDGGDHGFKANAFAQITAGASSDAADAIRRDAAEGAVSAGGELHYKGTRCDYIRAGGQARLAWRGQEGTIPSAEQWASVCAPIYIMELQHHLEWDVHPSLLSPLGLRPGANRRETVTFHWQPLRAPLPALLHSMEAAEAQKEGLPAPPHAAEDDAKLPHGDMVLFDVHVETTILWSRGGALSMRETPETAPFRYIREHVAPWGEHRDFVVDVFAGGGDFVDDGASVHVWILRLDNLKLGPLYTTGGIGIASADVGPFVSPVERQVVANAPRAVLAVETGGERVHGEVRATNDVMVAPDGYLALESRLASTIGSTLGDTRVALTGAVARTEIGVPDAMPVSRVHVTGGGALSAVHHFSSHLEGTVQLEVARSFYAARLAEQDFQPRWGVNAFAALQAVVGR